LGFKIDRAEISKTGMESGAVVEGLDVIKNGGASLLTGGEALVIDQLVFEAAPERLDKSVIVTVALAAHGSDEAVLGQDLAISGAGELRSAVGVDDKFSRRPALQEDVAP
jgi:hypothetical protein